MPFKSLLRRRWVRLALVTLVGVAGLGGTSGCFYGFGRGGHWHRHY